MGGRGGGTFDPIAVCHGCAARFDCRVQCPYSDVVRAVEDVKSRVPVSSSMVVPLMPALPFVPLKKNCGDQGEVSPSADASSWIWLSGAP